MKMNHFFQPLSCREMDILTVLWESEAPLVASEIAKKKEDLTINTVQAMLKKLLSKKLVEIDEIVYSGTVLTRRYRPAVSKEQFQLNYLAEMSRKMFTENSCTSKLVATLLEDEKDAESALSEIAELEKMLKAKKKEIMSRTERDQK